MNAQTATEAMARVDYVRTMLKQLQEMARDDGNDMLAYLIEMAYIEAIDIMRHGRMSKRTVDQGDGAA